ncbi:ABC transporter ATP-binding protein [Streptomyces celluloflavus]|uniref:ABC transporter ATP-binding protein n=1 Tax=Streptomyces celluloflavus TaxID=58344 RepID=UPI00345FB7AF|nr:ABC transporter ATP-binding protein [Streptomyces celluloflavus]
MTPRSPRTGQHPTPPQSPWAAVTSGLCKSFGTGPTRVMALDHVSVAFRRGEFTAVMGPSGSGKSTLMHCLAGLDSVSAGSAHIGDIDISRLSDRRLTRLRRDRIGFIFQAFHLVPTLTALENITLGMGLTGRRPDQRWLAQVIAALGLEKRLSHRPSQLSGGQQQRVACARALIGRPEIIFADEPTGNLDSHTGAEVLKLLESCVRHLGQTIVMVTHDPVAAAYAHRVVFLADGRVVDDMQAPGADTVLARLKDLSGHRPGSPAPYSGPAAAR